LLTCAPRTASARAATSVTLGRIRREGFEHLMQAYPALRETVWHEFSKRNFDNLLLQLPRYRHFDRADRRAWFEHGRTLELAAGRREPVLDGARFAFVLSGLVRAGSAEQRAVGLLELSGGELEAVEQAHVVLLPDPSPRSQVAPAALTG
jgi:hypothetical protein